MIQDVIIKDLAVYQDNRGWLSEIWRNDEADYVPAMGYASFTLPGVIRGPHEHHFQSDYFIFVGPGNFDLYLWDRRESSSTFGEHLVLTGLGQGKATAVIVPPGVVHGYKAVGDQPAYSINLPNKLYRGAGKQEEIDEIRWEQDAESPYKIL